MIVFEANVWKDLRLKLLISPNLSTIKNRSKAAEMLMNIDRLDCRYEIFFLKNWANSFRKINLQMDSEALLFIFFS